MNTKNIYDERKMIIDAFKNEIFPMVPTGFSEGEASTSSSESRRSSKVQDHHQKKTFLEKLLCWTSTRSSESRRSSESTRSSSEENVSGKITMLDNVLQPGLVRKYFEKNS